MTLVPDAPWWANVVMLLLIAGLPYWANRQSNKKHSAKIDRVLHSVENSHTINLRDDMDEKSDVQQQLLKEVQHEQRNQSKKLDAMAEVLGETREKVGYVAEDVEQLKITAVTDRRRVRIMNRRMTKALAWGQSVLDATHPEYDGPGLNDLGPDPVG